MIIKKCFKLNVCVVMVVLSVVGSEWRQSAVRAGRPERIYFLRDDPQLSSLEMAATFAPFLLSPPFALYLLSPPYGPYLLSPPIGPYLLSPPFTAIVLSVI